MYVYIWVKANTMRKKVNFCNCLQVIYLNSYSILCLLHMSYKLIQTHSKRLNNIITARKKEWKTQTARTRRQRIPNWQWKTTIRRELKIFLAKKCRYFERATKGRITDCGCIGGKQPIHSLLIQLFLLIVINFLSSFSFLYYLSSLFSRDFFSHLSYATAKKFQNLKRICFVFNAYK